MTFPFDTRVDRPDPVPQPAPAGVPVSGMLNKRFSPEGQSAFAARFEAQKIAFGPVVFQCVRYAWKRGVLQSLAEAGATGRTVGELAASGRWSAYALKVVLESCLSAGVVLLADGRYVLDKAGWCVLNDAITQINFDFVQDVCYQGLFELERSLDEQRPLGLKTLGDWPTLYEGMSELPAPARSSWFAFDHHYSDTSLPVVLPDVLATAPRRVMDIGANTGKFACALLTQAPGVQVHLVDLPQQLALAETRLAEAGLRERAHLHARDLLDAAAALPGDMDVVWMSQFLSCFSEPVILSILQRAVEALAPGGQLLILDTLWDRQRYDIAAYCLINTSPYFTALASGNSKVYESGDYIGLAQQAGLRLVTARDGIGYCHSLLRFARD
ncbi:class I SAM-dependent methyltransferase [Azohydromonas lata]|uniref:Class I SAM-dependent methyltransferase n=1 Tax=Azohydromonas lata TaxID=45677 RepID=A0ABU5IKR2_9BURK|nr:class I SAM-dependent methyltransferase [Azohydromonas lata]MDZ5459466.1 class I SAM-dependent methyltransferase [Azohydromonas lata]